MPMPDVPETRYVTVGDADVAYQVFGKGPPDLLYAGGMGSHIEVYWQWPPFAEQMRRLGSFSRVILFDRRGAGLSDAVSLKALPTWEEWAEDMTAVLDAAWSSRAAVFGWLDAGPPAMLFAAMHPERVSALVLVNTAARTLQDSDYPIGLSNETVDALGSYVATTWGTADLASIGTPGASRDAEWVRFLAAAQRASMTPKTAASQFDYVVRTSDVRWALPLVQVPTLVFHCQDNPVVPIGFGRYLVEHIPNSTLVELPGSDLGPSAPHNERIVTDEITRFLTGEQPSVDIERVLTTLVFTDIVGSTEEAAALGDQQWHDLLDSHDRLVREQIRRFRGVEIKTTGDGFLISFDGPARAIRCCQAIVESTAELGVEVRFGMHTGECEVRGDDLGGLAVHIAARVSALAAPNEVLVSGTVKDLVVGSGIRFVDRGEHELKGVPGTWKLFAVRA
jgi:class 3 adenylate cyclase/alpha-beta hydrolase superfamily lysophospholipase